MTATTPLTLTGEQNVVLTLPPKDPVLVKGSAGSGKTTVAVYRARHLLRTHQDLFQATRVAVFSYTNSLVNCVRGMLGTDGVLASTLHSFACGLLRNRGVNPQIESSSRERTKLVESALKAVRATAPDRSVLQKPAAFHEAEIGWIKGRCIDTFEQYAATPRAGRGTADRVTAQDRRLLWQVYEGYQAALAKTGKIDFDDLILCALRVAQQPTFSPPFSHVVVDEAQDHTFAQLSLVARLVQPETNSITLVADTAQRIYQSGFSWKDTGIRIVGARSVELRRNYRNTRQIAAAAASLLAKEEDRGDFTEPQSPERDGEPPVLLRCSDWRAQLRAVLARLRALPADESVLLASPSNYNVGAWQDKLRRADFAPFDPRVRRPAAPPPGRRVWVSTLHSAKGLQFDHVFLCDLCKGELPSRWGSGEPEEVSRARKLLYVGMTRARKTLTLAYAEAPSSLLGDIDPATLRHQTCTP